MHRTHTKHSCQSLHSTYHVHFTWEIQSTHVCTYITFRGASQSHTWLVQTCRCHNTVWNVIMLDRWISVNKSIMKRTVWEWELKHGGLKQSCSIGPGRFKQARLSGSVILHMTQYYPNKSHILIKTGILQEDPARVGCDAGGNAYCKYIAIIVSLFMLCPYCLSMQSHLLGQSLLDLSGRQSQHQKVGPGKQIWQGAGR